MQSTYDGGTIWVNSDITTASFGALSASLIKVYFFHVRINSVAFGATYKHKCTSVIQQFKTEGE